MPAAISYAPDDNELRSQAHTELVRRQTDLATAWNYYRGQQKRHLKVDNPLQDDNVTVNLCKQLVDRVVAFKVPKFPELELDELKDTDAEKRLRQTWKFNGGAKLLAMMVMNGALGGHVFSKVIRPQGEGGYSRIINLNPANVLVFWQADDKDVRLWYEIYYAAAGKQYRQDIVARDGYWEIIEYGASSSQYNEVAWERVPKDPEIWEYPLGPVVDWQHGPLPNDFYGASELGHLLLNDQTNKVASDVSRILRFHASPKTIGTGMDAADVQETAIDNFWTVENPAAKVSNLEMQTDLASSMNFVQFLADDFFAQGRVVVLKGTVSDFQRVTNLGIRALYIDQLAKNDELGWQYETGVEGISQRVRMLDGEEDYDAQVIVKWPDPLPQDPKEQTDALVSQREAGFISVKTAQKELGLNPLLEEEQMADEPDPHATAIDKFMKGETAMPAMPASTPAMGGNQ